MFYLDSSLIVALLAAEPESERAEKWIAGQPQETLAASDWVAVEVAAALAAKLRLGSIHPGLQRQALEAFAEMRGSLDWLDLGAVHFARAAEFAGDAQAKLRAGDALHLAIAAVRGATLVTFDRRQAGAGEAVGVATLLL